MLDRQSYERFRVSPLDPATIRVGDVEKTLANLASTSAGRLRIEQFAESFEGRPISLATLGNGRTRVLMWSQMHGDEPTHTAVVLDLISYLLQTPAEALAKEILAGCTLSIIPLLNPDGAERISRFNAQGIDVNRDARRLATPEGRALRRAVETLKPEFGFNLHNQNARRSVGTPPKPAAVSVLAPSADAAATPTPHMRRAKQLAACFVDAVRPFAEGMISRYDDEFEPRAFGDTIQASGAVTMLVEAGGWPEADLEPLVRLHFHGMLSTLHAIATGRIADIDPQIYESLPESNSRDLFDVLIHGGHVLDAHHGAAYKADLGIDHSHGSRLAVTSKRDGKIVEIGDLSTTAGKSAVDAAGCLILPGRAAFLADWTPTTGLPGAQLESLLSQGVTSVIGSLNLADREAIEALATPRQLPVNWGFVGSLDSARNFARQPLVEHVAVAAARGMLAVVGNHADEALWQQLDHFGLPLLQANQLPRIDASVPGYRELAQQIDGIHKILGLGATRGRIGRGWYADFQLFEVDAELPSLPAPDWGRLKRLVVAGETVWENGKRVGSSPGGFFVRGAVG
ncbi:MAG TPA: M14 family zinc carboxypeptidase [Lacipirellulaceae bacterium]